MTDFPHRVAVEPSEADLDRAVGKALDFIRFETIIPRDAPVFIKPDLAAPFERPGVTTSAACIEAVVRRVGERTRRITLIQSDGPGRTFRAEEAFAGNGLTPLVKRYGVRLVNLSREASRKTGVIVGGRRLTLEMPSILLHEANVFISMPVPKVDRLAGLSIALKNQWSCLSDDFRNEQTERFAELTVAVNKILSPRMVVCDGRYFLDREGPFEGEPVPMNLIIASDDAGAASLVVSRIMGLDPASSPHKRRAMRENLMPSEVSAIQCQCEPHIYFRHPFSLKTQSSPTLSPMEGKIRRICTNLTRSLLRR